LINFVSIYIAALIFFWLKGINHNYVSMKKESSWQDVEEDMRTSRARETDPLLTSDEESIAFQNASHSSFTSVF
jgi:hypothetical protein